jgi:polar amino acid transport system substrate-binding protein
MSIRKASAFSGLLLAGILAWCGATAVAKAQGSSCEPQKAAEKYPAFATRIVKIGVNSTYPPFSYNDPNDLKKITGLDVDIIEAVLNCGGIKFEYINGQHSGLYPALFSGALDVMIGNIFYRPDRAERASFLLFMITGQSLVVRKGNPKGIANEDGMCGQTASGSYNSSSAMLVQSISTKCIEKGKAGITWIPAADHEPAYRSLSNGRIDMVMDGTVSAYQRMRSMEAQNFDVAFSVPTDVKAGFIVRKGNNEMLKIVSDGAIELQKSGQLASLMKKYGLPADLLIPLEVRP